ncbi:Gamma-tubulin complex component [Heracleum sosnowskyi]|uniref:Gamma-tubulin complex component n=1 Tax=Heracleum sosnowskyi TaxID=360622 RepID=A0AAD8IY49_9APIA|nr:Gamma-tubulin complex component [Heracleum sosnowskyi]
MEVSDSLINKIYNSFSADVHFAAPISSLITNEVELVRGVLQILQGFSSSLFYWDKNEKSYRVKNGIFLSHLSRSSLHAILGQFVYSATCLRLVELVVDKVEKYIESPMPTLSAFTCCVAAWLKRLRNIALKEELGINNTSESGTTPTLLGLASSLSSLCSGAEYLLQIVRGAIPDVYFKLDPRVPAADISVHILNHLYKQLNAICLVEAGQEDAYKALLYFFLGSLLPCIQGLDSWLFEGILDDPFEEMFFYANKAIGINEAEFWEKSYVLRSIQYEKLVDNATEIKADNPDMGKKSSSVGANAKVKEQVGRDFQACPLFIKDIGKEIISAGKSLQLIRHGPKTLLGISGSNEEISHSQSQFTLSEVFCVSLAALIGQGNHISEDMWQDDTIVSLFQSSVETCKSEETIKTISGVTCLKKLLVDTSPWRRDNGLNNMQNLVRDSTDWDREDVPTNSIMDDLLLRRPYCHENPAVTVCHRSLHENKDYWNALNVSRNFALPPLNDEGLREAIFGVKSMPFSSSAGTNYAFGFHFGKSEYLRSQEEKHILEQLFPFPTLLPSFKEDLHVSEVLPFQRNSTLLSRVLNWIQSAELKATPLPLVIMQECLIVYIKKQVDKIGGQILSKLMYDWRLMDELGVLRTIYLLGSGDLLQHFLTVIFNKLDKGESWDDDFELNMVLQESIRNSADGMLLSAPDALVVSITKNNGSNVEELLSTSGLVSTPRKSKGNFDIDGLDSLKFTYKVPWPLELIANTEALKKYNQVMRFLLKVKRAKFVLDKARRWMWKDRSSATLNRKRHWLVEQKLLHFVDAFHQYVMDRVYHSAWRQLCEGMSAAGSLDEVIEVHEAYLLSIQRQCFVVPDKLWALIASRINTILGLALDFYSIQQTLSSGGAVSAIKARCEMEVDRIEKQFDDCIAFLLRVLSFKLNVGQFPHLADLVTRINYNYFYMSDSGNLVTAPATSKLGKSFAVRIG